MDKYGDGIMKSYLSVLLCNESFGVEINRIQEIFVMNKIVPLPKAPEMISGIYNLRGQVYPVISLRKVLGKRKSEDENLELIQFLKTTEADFQKIFQQIEESIEHKAKLSTSEIHFPVQFGTWLKTFKSNNRTLLKHIKQIEIQHQRMHSMVENLDKYNFEHEEQYTLNMAKEQCHTLKEILTDMFSKMRYLLSEDWEQVGLLTQIKGLNVIICVDQVGGIWEPTTVEELKNDSAISAIGHSSEKIMPLLNLDAIQFAGDMPTTQFSKAA